MEFGASRSPLIAVVGETGSGKTSYIRALADWMRESLGRQFDADLRLIRGPAALGPYVTAERPLPPTLPARDGKHEPIIFEWRREMKTGDYRSVFVTFYDSAGEDLSTIQAAVDLASLRAADAVMLILDVGRFLSSPDPIGREYPVDIANRATEAMRIAGRVATVRRIATPLAAVVTKIDLVAPILGPDHPILRSPAMSMSYDETFGQLTHEFVRAMLHGWNADDVDRHLRYNYENHRYFAASALGVAGAGQSFRVGEALTWLLSQFGLIPRVR